MKIIETLKTGFNKILFPQKFTCDFCGKELPKDDEFLCEECKSNLLFNDGAKCQKCGAPLINPKLTCEECAQDEEIYYNKGCSVFIYEGNIVQTIHKLKYSNKKYLANCLQKYLIDYYATINYDVDILIPIPLHEKRIKQRGYNQSELLCDKFAQYFKLAYEPQLLKRVVNTNAQTKLDFANRRENVKNCFEVKDASKVKGKNILVVDDVFTTGATINECCKVLKRANAKNVYFITLSSVKRY